MTLPAYAPPDGATPPAQHALVGASGRALALPGSMTRGRLTAAQYYGNVYRAPFTTYQVQTDDGGHEVFFLEFSGRVTFDSPEELISFLTLLRAHAPEVVWVTHPLEGSYRVLKGRTKVTDQNYHSARRGVDLTVRLTPADTRCFEADGSVRP